jgi:hypothetical protein
MVCLVSENGNMARPGKSSRPSNGGDRGNAAARRSRKGYLLTVWGDGETCPCLFCGFPLTFATVEADRVIPGALGGSYRRENVIPACRSCNARRGDKTVWEFSPRVARRLKRRGFVLTTRNGG